MYKRLRAAVRKKQPYFVFHWRGGALNQEILREIYEEACRAAAEKGKFAKLSVNAAQAVLEVSILDRMEGEEICAEEANEGEL